MSESSDPGQASIVFLGRESFRMQIAGAGAIPTHVWEGPTERIIDRRQISERRKAIGERRKSRQIELEAPVEAPIEPWPAVRPAWHRVVAISIATFACGVVLTIAANRLARHADAKAIAPVAQVHHAQPPATSPPPPAPAITVVPVVQQMPTSMSMSMSKSKLEVAAEPLPVPTMPNASPKAPRVATAPAARLRRPVPPAPAARATPVAAPATPTAKPVGPRKWVDPFAD